MRNRQAIKYYIRIECKKQKLFIHNRTAVQTKKNVHITICVQIVNKKNICQ